MDSFSAFADGVRHYLVLRGLEVPDHIRVQSEQEQANWHKERMKKMKNGKTKGEVWVENWSLIEDRRGKPSFKQIEEGSSILSGGKGKGKGKGKTARKY